MKIGILTFWWSNDNYGQLMQCYALHKYLCSLGHDVFLIRYNSKLDIKGSPLPVKLLKILNPVKVINHIKNKRNISAIQKEQITNDRHFEDFRNKYINFSRTYNSYSELKNDPPEADIYIVGSDQVWKCWFDENRLFSNLMHAYFLDFGKKSTKRLSYAARWGTTELNDSFSKQVAPLLNQFDFIGVREETGINLCTQCGRNDAEWTCDPTLLLSADDYRKLYLENVINKQKDKYLLLYMLNNEYDFDLNYVYSFAASKNLKVIYITGNGVLDNRDKVYASIPEWLYLIDNADYVVTNSFHCSVFSAIFHKKFGVIKLKGRHSGMNSRFDSLFSLLKLDKRYVADNDFSVLDNEYNSIKISPSDSFLTFIKN